MEDQAEGQAVGVPEVRGGTEGGVKRLIECRKKRCREAYDRGFDKGWDVGCAYGSKKVEAHFDGCISRELYEANLDRLRRAYDSKVCSWPWWWHSIYVQEDMLLLIVRERMAPRVLIGKTFKMRMGEADWMYLLEQIWAIDKGMAENPGLIQNDGK